MKTALIHDGIVLALGLPQALPDRLRVGEQDFPFAAIAGYSVESVPDETQPGWLREGAEWRAPTTPATADDIAAAIKEVDALCDAKRNRYISVGSLVVEEYRLAAKQAQAYKTAGYSGQVPAAVQSWAQAKGWTAQQAADDILAVEAAWMAVLTAIRSIRLPAKESARAATTREALAAIAAQVRAGLAAIPEG